MELVVKEIESVNGIQSDTLIDELYSMNGLTLSKDIKEKNPTICLNMIVKNESKIITRRARRIERPITAKHSF